MGRRSAAARGRHRATASGDAGEPGSLPVRCRLAPAASAALGGWGGKWPYALFVIYIYIDTHDVLGSERGWGCLISVGAQVRVFFPFPVPPVLLRRRERVRARSAMP